MHDESVVLLDSSKAGDVSLEVSELAAGQLQIHRHQFTQQFARLHVILLAQQVDISMEESAQLLVSTIW